MGVGYAMAMDGEWTKDMLLLWKINSAVSTGGLTEPARRALAERFGVSEEVLLRYERAKAAWSASIFPGLFDQAQDATELRMRELGRRFDPDELMDECLQAFHRIEAAMPENEITREIDEAAVALRAALDAATPKPAEGQ